MSNLSIESQVAELCLGALNKLEFAVNNPVAIGPICKALGADLKAIAGADCHLAIDRGIHDLWSAALHDGRMFQFTGNDAVRSIVDCVANDALNKSISNFMPGVLSE